MRQEEGSFTRKTVMVIYETVVRYLRDGVYGHRTLEELRTEIEKIEVPEE